MEVAESVFRTPGEVLGRASEYLPGRGTYVREDVVCSSLVGAQRVTPPQAADQRPTIEVVRDREQAAVPETGAQVTGKVVRLNARQATVDVLCVGTRAVKDKFVGVIRREDVRATEIDKVEMASSFRPGDIIRAEVLSLGDARNYFLTTAKNELGVVFAKSMAGVAMVPLSWQEMQCPETKAVELRKVAKLTK